MTAVAAALFLPLRFSSARSCLVDFGLACAGGGIGASAGAGLIKDGGEGGFWEGEPGPSAGRGEGFQSGEPNLSDSKPWMGGEEG